MARRDARVGVRELRQNLSVYLRRVEAGETLEVTERGRAVARLTPLSDADTALGRLVAAGRAKKPDGDLLQLGRPRGRASTRLSAAVLGDRSDRL